MSKTTNYGTVGGEDITDEVVDRLVQNAEAGFPGVTPRRATGRPAHQEMTHSFEPDPIGTPTAKGGKDGV